MTSQEALVVARRWRVRRLNASLDRTTRRKMAAMRRHQIAFGVARERASDDWRDVVRYPV